MDAFHGDIAPALNTILTERPELPAWLTIGRSVMILKKDNPSASDHRPITYNLFKHYKYMRTRIT